MSNNNRNRNGNRQRAQQARQAAGAHGGFTFHHRGRQHHLPPASEALAKVKADVLIDGALAGDYSGTQMNLGMAMIAAVADDLDPAALAALRDKGLMEFGETIGRWMNESGAEPGKSADSSS